MLLKTIVLDGYALNPGDLSWDDLAKIGDCQIYDRTENDEIFDRIFEAEAVITNKVVFNEALINRLPKLKYIGVTATGYNVIDCIAAKKQGIIVTNIPAYSTNSVAQLVFAHILNITNRVELHANSVNKGEWANNLHFSYWKSPQVELSGKTIGIVGFGKIGRKVAKIASAFDMNVIFNNRSIISDIPSGCRQVGIDELFADSDFVSLNCPLTFENESFVNFELLSKMKKESVLINTGRGALINESDLAEALNSGIIAAAGLDVLSVEPPKSSNPLFTAKNCFISPHIAWATIEARKRLMKITIDNLKSYLNGQAVNVVNS